MHRCSQALLAGLILSIAGLRGENLLTTAGAETSTATDLTPNSTTVVSDNNIIITTNTSSVKDTPAKATKENVSTSGAAVKPPSVTVLPTSQHELSSPTFITPNSSASIGPNFGVSSTGRPENTSTLFTSQMSQAPQTINSTGSPTSNYTAVTSKPTNTTATHIQNSQSPSSPESFSPKTGITQMTGATATVASTPNSVNNSTNVSHPTVAVSPTVSTTMHGNVVSTVPQSSTVAMEQTVAAATKNTSPNTATAAVKEASTALSSGSVAAITVTVLFFVLVIFGGAAYLKIRHSSYGRLVDDQDYGSWGNYNNPLYDDS